jgi:WD40 repeat protein
MRWLKWGLVAGWLGAHAWLWAMLPPVPTFTFADPSSDRRKADQVCSFTDDGTHIIVNHEDVIRDWDLTTGRLAREIPRPPASTGETNNMVLSPIGQQVLIYDETRNAPLFLDLDSGERIELPAFGEDRSVHYLGGFGRLVTFAPDGAFLCSGWETTDEHVARYFPAAKSPPALWRLPDCAEYMAFSTDGRWAVSTARSLPAGNHERNNGFCLIDVASGRVVKAPTTDVSTYGKPAFSHDGRTLATGKMRWPKAVNLEGQWLPASVQLWDMPSLTSLAILEMESLVGWCPDGRLVTASEDDLGGGPHLRIRDGRTGALLAAYSIDVFGATDFRAEWLYDTFRGRLIAASVIDEPPAWRRWLANHFRFAALTAAYSYCLPLVDIDTGRTVTTLPASSDIIAISPDGRNAAIVEDGVVHIYELPPRKLGGIVLGLMIAEVALFIAGTSWRRRLFRKRAALAIA